MADVVPRIDVAIAGASFAGLALAIALAQAGGGDVSILVIDRHPAEPDPAPDDPRAVAVSQASRRLLDHIGIWKRIEQHAQPVARIEISDSPLQAGVRPVLLAWNNAIDSDPASYIVPNAALEQALTAAAGEHRSISVVRATEATELTQDEFGCSLSDRRGYPVVTARLAVAADGRHSTLRRSAGIRIVGWDYPQRGIVTRIRHERSHDGIAVQHFLPGGPFALLPLPGNRSCVTWTEDEAVAQRIVALDETDFMAELESRFGGRLGPLVLDGRRLAFPLGMHLARRFVARRLALIGDAAHSVHPLAGQGLNLALRDVAALAECVIENMRAGLDPGDMAGLERYERWRRFDSWLSAATFDGLNRLFSRDSALLRSAREAGLQAIDRMPVLKQLFMREAAGLMGELPRLLKGEPI